MKHVTVVLQASDPIIARVCKHKFEKIAGWDIVTTTGYKDTLSEAQTTRPAILIVELDVADEQGHTGIDLIIAVAESQETPTMKIVALGDAFDDIEKRQAIEAGATHYYAKNDSSIMDIIHEMQKELE